MEKIEGRRFLLVMLGVAMLIISSLTIAGAEDELIPKREREKLQNIEKLKGNDERERRCAILSLMRLEEPAVKELIGILDDRTHNSPLVRAGAAETLQMVGEEAWGAIESLSQVVGGFGLRLMSSLNDVSGIPTEGKGLIIVAAVKNVLHFRIFDGDGKAVVDTDEQRLTEQAQQIGDLRKKLESLWPPHELTGSERNQVTKSVTSIVDYTPAGGTKEDPLVRVYAAYALMAIVHTNPPKVALDALGNALNDRDGEKSVLVRHFSAIALGSMGPAAVNDLKERLTKETDAVVKYQIYGSLGQIGRTAGGTVDSLIIQGLKDPDDFVCSGAAGALKSIAQNAKGLGNVSKKAKEAVSELKRILSDPKRQPLLRRSAAKALGPIGQESWDAIPELEAAVNDDDVRLASGAASSLGQIGQKAMGATLAHVLDEATLARVLDDLIAAIRSEKRHLPTNAADAAVDIAGAAVDIADAAVDIAANLNERAVGLTLEGLEQSIDRMKKVLDAIQSSEIPSNAKDYDLQIVRDSLAALEQEQARRLFLWRWIQAHPRLFVAILYAPFLLALWSVLLLLRPIWILRINDALETPFRARPSGWYPLRYFGGLLISAGTTFLLRAVQVALLVKLFHYNRLVLADWVKRHAETAEAEFSQGKTVALRDLYISVPAIINDERVDGVTAEAIRALFARSRGCVLIGGEGGAGQDEPRLPDGPVGAGAEQGHAPPTGPPHAADPH